ncbi:MAG: sulfatase-like hydrolase/transferase, partial [Myxococcota bacterium]|nr:sulfatase-like hydrolase/transferase [Myxococcota bacterium]
LTSDHGEGLDESDDHGHRYHGPTLYDEVVRVPLLVCGPGVVPRRVSTVVSLIDLAPTFAALAGLDQDPSFRGISLGPWLEGRDPAHPPVFFEKHKDTALPQKGMVLWPYKVIVTMAYNRVKIYDLAHDPRERVNLSKTLDRDKRAHLVGLLNHWAHEVLEVRKPRRTRTAKAE